MDDPKFPPIVETVLPEVGVTNVDHPGIEAKIDNLYRQLDELASDADEIYRRESSDAVAGAALITRALRLSATINLAAIEERVASEARFEASRERDRQAIRETMDHGTLEAIESLGKALDGLFRVARRLPGWREAELAELASVERSESAGA